MTVTRRPLAHAGRGLNASCASQDRVAANVRIRFAGLLAAFARRLLLLSMLCPQPALAWDGT
jgi:hypothetical protein